MDKPHTFRRFADVAAAAATAQPCRLSRPEADPRFHPWWQIRSLIASSRLLLFIVAAALLAAAFLAGQRPFADAEVTSRGSIDAGIGGIAVLIALYVARHVGPARSLHRAAIAPLRDEVRYVLLSDPQRRYAPALVLFPFSGGPDAVALGVIPLQRPVHGGLGRIAPGLQRWTKRSCDGLPAPIGTAQLHGGPPASPLVVPWIDGQPLWPAGPMITPRPGRPHALAYYLDRLLLGSRSSGAKRTT
ncbi:hypothetical protein [Streptomyces boninensis]|uniref:hypothetical protein n=1 Tax=Streptomyces boninensis TaxID=2039455 RepID=UPI003B22314D